MKFLKEETYARIMHMILLVLFTGLFVVGFAVTGVNLSIYDEHVILSFNNPLYIALYLLAGWFLFKGLSALYDRFLKNVKPIVFAAVTSVIVYALAVIWIISAKANPQSDADILITFARAINLNEIGPGALGPDDYLIYFPYQYGFVTFLRVVMGIFGEDNTVALMYATALSLPVIAFSGTGIVTEIAPEDKKGKSVFFFCILTVLFVPLYFYSCFIYGDLPFAALSLACVFFALRTARKPSVLSFVFFFLSCFLNYLFKSNALIVFIALFIFFAIRMLNKENRKTAAVLTVLLVLSVVSVSLLNNAMYSKYNPEGYDSIPMSATIAMGLNDDNGYAGWCNFYHQITFVENGYDSDMTSKVSWGQVRYSLTEYVKHPGTGLSFLYRKINLQWNTPLFQGLAMICSHDADSQNALGKYVYDNFDFQWKLNSFMKAYQIFVYFVIASVLWIFRKRESQLKQYVPGIAVFGSFLFSIIWEAKTRYIFPTFVMIIVCAAVCIPIAQDSFKEILAVKINDYFGNQKGTKRPHYNGIDLFKFVMALFVISAHVMPYLATDNAAVYAIFDNLSNCSVDFFFITSGFLLAGKLSRSETYEEKRKAILGYLLHLLKLYLIWTAIYLPLEIAHDIIYQVPVKTVLLNFVQRTLFVGEHYNSWILWYLLSSVAALGFMLLLLKLNIREFTWLVIIGSVYLFAYFLDYIASGSLAGSPVDAVISPVLRVTFLTGRIFRGLFFLPLGLYLSRKRTNMIWGTVLFVTGIAVSVTGLFGEVPQVLLSVGIFIVARQIKLPDMNAWPFLRKMSMALYFIHLYVWTIIYWILFKSPQRGLQMYVYTTVISLLIAVLYAFLSGLFKKNAVVEREK